ncbi:MAG: sulfite exporter TauE/SafE family protein [Chloroflexi bacterium]|nr:sulfite exporter TauE/SafE family protein [Chloroflexota bacterium]
MIAALVMMGGGVAAGTFGSLLGLGGGLLIVPLLTFGFNLSIREAVAISLVCVIVTSSASAGVFLQRRVANLRLGMTLEFFTALGALVGGLIAFTLSDRILAGLFALLLVYVAISMIRRREPAKRTDVSPALAPPTPPGIPPAEASEELAAAVPPIVDDLAVGAAVEERPAERGQVVRPTVLDRLSTPDYRVRNVGPGVAGSLAAGVTSALLGVGGGIIKVPVMNLLMGVPLRVATATSNLMIGVTASAGAIVYLLRGGIDPLVAGPTAVGVFVGASIGSRIAHRVDVRVLRALFVVVLLYTAIQMALRAMGPG